MHSRTLSYSFWIAGGFISLFITMWGCFASIIFDLRKLGDLSLALCLVAPMPCFLIGFYSKRWSATLLWLVFVALWWNRAHIRPNPELNPLDGLGTMYVLPAVAVQVAIFCAPKKNVPLPSE
jgi:hypothetical protein